MTCAARPLPLVKIDIVKWGMPVTRPHHVQSVPSPRVHDAGANPVGRPGHDVSTILSCVAKAKDG